MGQFVGGADPVGLVVAGHPIRELGGFPVRFRAVSVSVRSSGQPVPVIPPQGFVRVWRAVAVEALPLAGPVVPGRFRRPGHPGELELQHGPVAVGDVGAAAVPQVVVNQRKGAGPAFQEQRLLGFVARSLVVVLRARDDAGRPHLGAHRLRIVEDHGPPLPVVAYAGVAPVAVLVPGLDLAARRGEVAVPVRLGEVVGTQYAADGTADDRMAEDLLDFGDARQDVVAGVALPFHDRFNPGVHGIVETVREVRVEDQVAVGNEMAHLLVGEQNRIGCHGGTPGADMQLLEGVKHNLSVWLSGQGTGNGG